MKLIVGLGNPGSGYERTRHNAGFLAADALAARHARGVVPRARFQSVVVETTIEKGPAAGERVLLMKPVTYMNRSGQAVAEAVRFYKIHPASDVLVLVDDVYLPSGSIRLRGEGGAGGHNGLADVERLLATPMYARCRIGVDAPGIIPQADYVLGRFTPEQWEKAGPAIERAADAAEVWAGEGLAAAMNKFNAKERAPTEKGAEGPGGPGG